MPASDILSFTLVGFFIYREYKKHHGGPNDKPEKA
jgi:hypothetical protein